jgi:hypothetical protein
MLARPWQHVWHMNKQLTAEATMATIETGTSTLCALDTESLKNVVGGAPATSAPWNDGMSNGCGDGGAHILPNGTWRQACVDHDHTYRDKIGSRLGADVRLFKDMRSQGASLGTAAEYFTGVRVGAASHWGQQPANPGSH